MNVLNTLKLTALSVALAGSMGGAYAAPCLLTDVTYGVNGPAVTTQNANACVGPISENITPSDAGGINNLGGLFGGAEFAYGDATDAANGGAVGVYTFTLTAPSDAKTGTYTLTATPSPISPAILLDFAIAFKASNVYSVYLFDNVSFDGSGGGSFNLQFTAIDGNAINGLSHATVYVRGGSSDTTSLTTSLTVVEPGSSSLAMLGLGLLGAGFVLRRKSLGR